MSTVAIICEYNPFHSGHAYQIEKIRREFGEDTVILALMSGNFTQRGEAAIADKMLRARCAVECGINLCIELPFPFSMSSAELFSLSGIRILNALGTVDYLSFGSESGDIEALYKTAEYMLTPEYQQELSSALAVKEDKNEGYPKMCERALAKVAQNDTEYVSLTPNNILAIEYIKALISTKSKIKPHTVKRDGADYNEESIIHDKHQSASAIRNALASSDVSALDFVPETAKKLFLDAISTGFAPCDEERVSAAVIASLRLSSPDNGEDIHDVGGGLYNRLIAKSFEANTITDLIRLCETKKFTKARLRRSVWYSFFGVTSSEVKAHPAYTSLLAADSIGTAELKRIKRSSDFPIITKPSAIEKLPEAALRQKRASDKADSIFQMTKPSDICGNYALTATPYVKK